MLFREAGKGWRSWTSRDSWVLGQSWTVPSSCSGQLLEGFKQRMMGSFAWFPGCSLAAPCRLDLQHCQGRPV